MKNATLYIVGCMTLLLVSCCAGKNAVSEADSAATEVAFQPVAEFDADSAYLYVSQQVAFGPRVPGSEAHRRTGNWLASELKRHGAEVTEQKMSLTTFDGTKLNARNIIGQYNPEATDRVLLMAHWDCRPWADQDPDPAKQTQPVDGANDGASGVGVLLEIARQLAQNNPSRGVDIAFVDAEDWGEDGNDETWALGARYLANNPFKQGWRPSEVILLDMVGGENARFRQEYFSLQNSPALLDKVWRMAAISGYEDYFLPQLGGAVTDDHVEFTKMGIPAIDIIEYNEDTGFNPRWHTSKDNMEGIDRRSLKAAGQTVLNYILQ